MTARIIKFIQLLVLAVVIIISGFRLREDPGSIYPILTAIVAGLGFVFELVSTRFEKELTIAEMLATSYARNFINPAISKILNNSGTAKMEKFLIYLPDKMTEMNQDKFDAFKEKLDKFGFDLNTITIKTSSGERTIDELTNRKTRSVYYLDYPRILLALLPLIERICKKKKREINDTIINKFASNYITYFKNASLGLIPDNSKTKVKFIKTIDDILD